MEPLTIRLVVLPERCYRCRGVTRGIVGVLAPTAHGHVFREFDDLALALAEVLDDDVLAAAGIGPLKLRHSRVRGTYVSNGCVHCDAILGSFPLWEGLNEYLSEGGDLYALEVRMEA